MTGLAPASQTVISRCSAAVLVATDSAFLSVGFCLDEILPINLNPVKKDG